MKKLPVTFLFVLLSFGVTQGTVCDAARNAEDWVIAGKDGWLFARSDLLAPIDISLSLPYLERLNKVLLEQGITLVMVVNPKRGYVTPEMLDFSDSKTAKFIPEEARMNYQLMIEKIRSTGILAPDMLEVALDMPESEQFFFKVDHHWRPLGAKAAAQAVANLVTSLEAYQALPKTPYISFEEGTFMMQGGWADKVEKACGVIIDNESYPVFVTETENDPGLLTEVPPTDVVLLGTSFSKSARKQGFNFEGFLRESLQLDLLNAGVTAGGPFSSILSYFMSKDYKKHKPKFLIWELSTPVSRSFNDATVYRQLIPAIKGGCSASTSIQTNSVTVTGTSGVLLVNTDMGIKGQNYFISLKTKDPTFVAFTLILKYQNGEQERLEIERSTRTENNGEFLIELSGGESPLAEAVIETADSVSLMLETQLCHVE